MNLAHAQSLALKIREELAPYCDKIEIAGSIRRERAEVIDIDIVLIPAKTLDPIIERVTRKCVPLTGRRSHDPRNLMYRMPNGCQLDLFIAHGEIVDLAGRAPTNWGAVLLCRTGSIPHNIKLCSFAHAKGLKFAPYRGILDGEKVIASETEEDIYAALGLPYREPRERETLT